MSVNPEKNDSNGVEEQVTAPGTENAEAEAQKPAAEAQETEPAAQEPEVESTIFAKHVYNTKKPAKNGGKKRILICVTALVLCAVIGLGVFLGNKYLTVDDTVSTPSVIEEESIPVLDMETIVKPSTVELDGEKVTVDTNIASVYFVNGYDEFEVKTSFVKAEKEETTSSSSTSSEQEFLYDTVWYVEGIDRDLTMSDAIADKIEDCLNIDAFREMENTYSSVDEYHEYYGMKDKLTAGFVVTFNDGTEPLTVSVGNALATYDSYYLMTSLSDTVYAVKSEYADHYFCSTKEFADPTIIAPIVKDDDNASYFNTNNQLARFDKIKVYGGVFGDEVYEFAMNKGVSADYMPYRMTAPYARPASDEFIAGILGFASDGLDATVLYSYAITDKDIEECGFDDPKCVIELTVDDYSFKLIIGGSRGDGTESMTATVEGKTQAFGINQDDLAFIINASNDRTLMFNPNFILEDIYTIKNVEFEVESGKYQFDLKHTLREGETDVYDTEVKLGSTIMNTQSFKLIYQRVLMLSLLEFVTEAERTDPVLTVTFNYIGDSEPRVVEFTESPDDMYHYVAWVDGTPLGEVLKSSLDDITSCLDTYLNGGEVPDTW